MFEGAKKETGKPPFEYKKIYH